MAFSGDSNIRRASAVDGKRNRVRYEERHSDSPFVERVWRTQSDADDDCIAIADGRWDMMFFMETGKCHVMITGPQTTVIDIPHVAGAEWLGIRFRLGVAMQNVLLNDLINEGIDLPAAAQNSFWLNSSAWALPDYENADTFVDRLARNDMLVYDTVIPSVLRGDDVPYSVRALQYRFQHTTGLSYKTIQQIERAQAAKVLLEDGASVADTTFQLGYYDQAHLINSLRRYIGRTPLQITKKSRAEMNPK
jgi:hypothetical protein